MNQLSVATRIKFLSRLCEALRCAPFHAPPMHVHFETRKVEDIAYFHLNCFFDPLRVMKAFGDTVRDNLKAVGLATPSEAESRR